MASVGGPGSRATIASEMKAASGAWFRRRMTSAMAVRARVKGCGYKTGLPGPHSAAGVDSWMKMVTKLGSPNRSGFAFLAELLGYCFRDMDPSSSSSQPAGVVHLCRCGQGIVMTKADYGKGN